MRSASRSRASSAHKVRDTSHKTRAARLFGLRPTTISDEQVTWFTAVSGTGATIWRTTGDRWCFRINLVGHSYLQPIPSRSFDVALAELRQTLRDFRDALAVLFGEASP